MVGRFDNVNGIQRSDIARLNADGSLDTQFDAGPRIRNQGIAQWVFVEPDGKILVSGYTNTNNTKTYYLVRLIGNSTLQFTSFTRTAAGFFKALVAPTDAGTVRIDISPNLRDWTSAAVLTNSTGPGSLEIIIPAIPSAQNAFYRAVLQ